VAKTFKKRTFTVDDDVIVEGDKGGTMYFIVTGLVTVLHKKTQTYIIDLKQDQYFGEIGFFTDKPRSTTIKSRDFTEVLELEFENF
jgi:CRP-like cAMP-binding protein